MDKRSLIKKILLAFEQSSTKIKYEKIYKYDDGPNDIKQITVSFGITEYGNLKNLIKNYCFANGLMASEFMPYLNQIGTKSLVNNDDFIDLLKRSASDPIMQQCQEKAYDDMYIDPAYNFCSKNLLTLPLSHLVISDSYLQSGSILNVIRNQFTETLPVNGGNEAEWILAYCKTRKKWLANHSRTVLHTTTYRMDFMLDRIKENDWNLEQEYYLANDVKVSQ